MRLKIHPKLMLTASCAPNSCITWLVVIHNDAKYFRPTTIHTQSLLQLSLLLLTLSPSTFWRIFLRQNQNLNLFERFVCTSNSGYFVTYSYFSGEYEIFGHWSILPRCYGSTESPFSAPWVTTSGPTDNALDGRRNPCLRHYWCSFLRHGILLPKLLKTVHWHEHFWDIDQIPS